MSVKHAILGLLVERPSHGYAIHAAFEQRLSDFWELNFGQVYQVLTALEREGLITGRDERIGKRPPRKVYSVTPRGQAALNKWLVGPTDRRRRPFRDDFYIRFLFADHADCEKVCSMIDTEIAHYRERLAHLTDRRDAVMEAGESYVPRLFAAAAVRHAEADLESLKECRTAVMQLERTVSKQCGHGKASTSTAPARRAALRA